MGLELGSGLGLELGPKKNEENKKYNKKEETYRTHMEKNLKNEKIEKDL